MTSIIGTLVVAGVHIPVHTLSPFSQTYGVVGGSYTRRMMNGSAKKQTNWEKIVTTISAGGTIPPGLVSVNFNEPYTLLCGAVRSVRTAGNSILLPPRRTDAPFVPRGRALVGAGWVDTSVSMLGDVATVSAVSSAVQYEVSYYPSLLVVGPPPAENVDVPNAEHSWTLTAEEA